MTFRDEVFDYFLGENVGIAKIVRVIEAFVSEAEDFRINSGRT